MSDAIAPTVEEVEAIIALDQDPILRNLKITQGYHDLAQAIAVMVGKEHVNWCVFAVWASKTAGRFIRLGELNTECQRILIGMSGFRRWLIGSIDKKLEHLGLRHTSLRAFIDEIAAETSRHITRGNLIVFAELAPLFSTMVYALGDDAVFDGDSLHTVIAPLKPGLTEEGGQEALRDAVAQFYQARFETDPKRKAEQILRANAQTGLHEQIRLQEAIAGSINAPLAEGLHALCDEIEEKLPAGFLNSLYRIFLNLFRGFVIDEVQRRWQEVTTEHLMELRLPDATLRLGRDVPVAPGQPPFPLLLQTIEDDTLRTLLARFNAADASLRDSQAENWTDLKERLGYILDLFRSRQQDQGLFAQPFTPAQRRAIAEGHVPQGDL